MFRVDGVLALLLLLVSKLDQKIWKKHLRHQGKNAVIHVSCDEGIYGTVTTALLTYKKLLGHLMDWGFEMNPYEPCCWIKMINSEQFTIVLHVDDLKLSHKDME